MYEFGADSSTMHGTWEEGNITEGKWVFKVNARRPGRTCVIARCPWVWRSLS